MTPSFRFTRAAVVAVLVTASVGAGPASTPYRIVDLGSLLGPGPGAMAHGINDRGQIVGISQLSAGGEEDIVHAVLWDRGGITDLGTLAGRGESYARAINNSGQIVGHSGSNAVLWDHGAIVDLGSIDQDCTDGYCFSYAIAINDRGQIVGYGSEPGPAQSDHAILWDHGTIADLGTLTGSGRSMAVAINDRGQIAGISDAADGMPHAVIWDQGTITDLGLLPGINSALAAALNNRGQVVGNSGYPVIWQQPAVITRLEMPAGYTTTTAINNRGQVVGYSYDPDSTAYPLLWEGGKISTRLGADGIPTAINARGQIVGYYSNGACLWTR